MYYGNQGRLEYDFIVTPGQTHERSPWLHRGHDDIEKDGDLVLAIAGRRYVHASPYIYQEIGGNKACDYRRLRETS